MADHEKPSPLTRLYDVFSFPPLGDVDFFVQEASQAQGPVLELACGTGRVLIPVAEAGVEIMGLDLSAEMLDSARKKISALPRDVQQRITLVQGNMTSFSQEGFFALIMIPFNSLYLLDTPEAQRACLQQTYANLKPGGRLVFSVFDPNTHLITEHTGVLGSAVKRFKELADPRTGQRIIVYESRSYDLEAQTVHPEWVFETIDEQGVMVSREYTQVVLRYAYRYEMQYLLELCGFKVEALYGDFGRGPFRHGNQQVWIARRP